MRKALKAIGILVGVAVAGIALFVGYELFKLDAFRTVTPHFAGSCVKILGATGAEDVVVDAEGGVAYISATDRRAQFQGAPHGATPDGIYRLTLSDAPDADAKLQYMPVEGLSDFHPHGIDIRKLPDGSIRIFAVNHNQAGHGVEILNVESDRLVHLQTVQDPLIISPNDVTAVGPQEFYVTNDKMRSVTPGMRPQDSKWRQYIRLIGKPEPTTVVYWDGTAASVAAGDLITSNGIEASSDDRKIYVSERGAQNLVIYDRDTDGKLTLKEKIYLDTAPDNISVAPDGSLFIAGHPLRLKLVTARGKAGIPTPSQILLVTPKPQGPGSVREIYMNKGDEITMATVAAPYGKDMFIMGNVNDEIVLVCRRDGSE